MKHTKQLFMILLVVFLLVGLTTLAASDVTKDDTTSVTKTKTIAKDTTTTTKLSTTTKDKDNTKIVNTKAKSNTNEIINNNTIKKTNTINDIKKESTDNYDKDNIISLKKNDAGSIKAAPETHRFSQLQAIINNASEGSEIELEYDYVLTYDDTTLLINKALTINGNNHTLDGRGMNRIMHANYDAPATSIYDTTNSLILKDINFINGGGRDTEGEFKDDRGGAIYYNTTSTTTTISAYMIIINCTFEDNGARDDGGAIYANGGVIINDSSFFDNTARDDGGAIYISERCTPELTRCDFSYNYASDDGGAIYLDSAESDLKVFKSSFYDNHAKGDGGAIYSKGQTTINHSIFTINGATSDDAVRNFGGAIRSEGKIIVDNSDFGSNYAGNLGGAIYADKEIAISNSKFIRNSGRDGGAVYADIINNEVNNSVFRYNDAYDGHGGAIYIDNKCNPIFNNCEFRSNKAEQMFGLYGQGGAIYCERSGTQLKVNNTNFIQNNADNGGAIYLDGTDPILQVSNSIFLNNIVKVDGGAINCEGQTTITYSTFKSNVATGENIARSFGGAIRSKGDMTVDNSHFIENSAYNLGGAIYADKEISIRNSNFTSNSAKEGGAVYTSYLSQQISSSNFTNNKASDGCGGAIYINNKCSPKIINSRFDNNNCSDRGGSIYTDSVDSVLTVTGSNFTSNFAKQGGAIYSYQLKEISGSMFLKNKASESDGGAVYINRECQPNIQECVFEENTCVNRGGAIYLDSTSSIIRLYGSSFTSNSANQGGAVYAYQLSPYLSLCNFTGNKAKSGDGGALYVNRKCQVEFMYSIFSGNTATGRGGAVYFDSKYSYVKITNCSLTSNIADQEGGALYLHQLNDSSQIIAIGNQAGKGGGAIYIANDDPEDYSIKTHLTGSYFKDNYSSGSGGGVYMGSSYATLKVSYSTFINNKAGNGGGVFVAGEVTGISDSIFLKNMAFSGYGGAVNIQSKSSDLQIIKCRFGENVASKLGGAVYIDSVNTNLKVSYCSFVDNTARNVENLNKKAGHDIYNKGEYTYNKLNWFGWNNPSFDNRCVEYKSSGDINNVPSNYLRIYISSQYDASSYTFISGNPYPVYVRFYSSANEALDFNTYPLYHSTGVFGGDGTFSNIQADKNDMTATVVFNSGAKSINATLDHETLTMNVNVKDKNPCTVTIDPISDVFYPSGVTVAFTISTESSNPTYEIKNSKGTTVKTGEITSPDTLYIEGLKHGNYSITINNSESWTTLPASATANFKILRSDIESLSIVIDDKTYPEEIEGIVYSSRDGVYNITIGEQNTTVTVEGGTATFNIGTLSADNYQATVSFEGDDYYNPFSNDTTFTVYPLNTQLDLEVNPSEIVYGKTVTVAPILPGTATGTVKYYINGTLIDELGVDKNFTLPLLDVGTYEIKGNYSGDNNHKTSEKTITITVGQAPNTARVKVSNVTYKNATLIEVSADVDGTYLVYINGTVHEVLVENAIGNKTINLDAGKYYANITFNNKNYDTNAINTVFEVYEANTDLTITALGRVYPQEVTGFIYSNVDGEYELTVANKSMTIPVNNSIGEFNLGTLDAGQYTITAKYPGDNNHKSAQENITITVGQAPNNAIVSATNVTYGQKTLITVSADIDGTYLVFINSTTYNVTVQNAKGNLSLALDAGNYYANVTFKDKNYNTTTQNTTFKVDKADTIVIIVANDTTYPQEITGIIRASVDGNYDITVGDYTGNIIVKDGTGKFNTGQNNAGNYQIMVKNPGDKNHNPATSTLMVKVNPLTVIMDVESSNINVGQTEKITVKLPSTATGNITITLEDKNYTAKLINGQTTVSITNLTVGSKIAKVYYTGDKNHNPTASTTSFNVNPLTVVMDVVSDNIKVGETEKITVKLPSTATGNITITLEDKNYTAKLINGQTTVSITNLTVGSKIAKVYYTGDKNHNPTASTTSFNVNPLTVVMDVVSDNIKVGETEKITVKLPSTATGNITITLEDKNYTAKLINGQTTVSITNLTVGSKIAKVYYTGDKNHNPATTTTSFNVNPHNTTITINPIKSSIGSVTIITAAINDEHGQKVTGGKVIFKINGITLKDENNNPIYAQLKDGAASINYKVPSHWIKNTTYVEAVYSGVQDYTSSRSITDNINITKGKATITLDKHTKTVKAGQTITLRAKILDSNGDRINNDKVVFKLNGKTLTDQNGKALYVRVKDGEAILEYTIPSTYSAKNYTLIAVFGGNYYERTVTLGTITVEKKATTINPESISTTKGKTTIKAKITDETGKTLISSTKVVIKINGKTITSTTSTNGLIDTSFTTTLKPGSYELSIISGENGQYQKSTLTTVLKI